MNTRSNQKFYDEYYNKSYDYSSEEQYLNYFLSKINFLKVKKNSKFLDVGCGAGALGYYLKKFYRGVEVSGIDISDSGVKKAKASGMKAKVGDIEKKWEFADGSFDVVTGQEIIEHLVNPDHFLQESKRVLKTNGLVIVTTPNLGCWYNRILLLLGYQPFFTEVSTLDKTLGISFTRNMTNVRTPLGHLRVFTLRGLVDLLEMHGFKIVKVNGGRAFFLPRFMQVIDRFFSNIPSLASDLVVVARKL